MSSARGSLLLCCVGMLVAGFEFLFAIPIVFWQGPAWYCCSETALAGSYSM